MARSGIIYGGTGSRKTSQVKRFAHYIAETTGKATLLLSMDGGGWAPCQPEVDADMIQPYFCDPGFVPLPTLRRISQGYWPKDVSAPANAIDLLPMDFSRFGGVAVEGWTSIGSVAMRYLPDKGINVGGEDRAKLGGFTQSIQVGGRVVEEVFRSSTRGDYGFVQNFLYGLVMNFNSLPVRYVLYTALESKTEDDDRTTVFGPAIAGKKATAQCGAWVGDMIHAQDYAVEHATEVPDPSDATKRIVAKTIETTVRFYFKKHPDPTTGILFPAKPRVTPERVRDLDKEFPGGYFEPTTEWGFDRYLHLVDKLSATQTDSLRGWRERMDQRLGRGDAQPTESKQTSDKQQRVQPTPPLVASTPRT